MGNTSRPLRASPFVEEGTYLNPVLRDMYASCRVTSRSGKTFEIFPGAVGSYKGQSLYEWVRRTRPRVTLETGFAFGASTLAICQGLHDTGGGTHHVMDPLEVTVWDSVGLDAVERAGFRDLVRFYDVPSHVQLPRLLEANAVIEFAFLDGQKLFDYLLVDCFYVDRLLPVGGVIVLDDPWLGSVNRLARFLISNRGYRVVEYTNRLVAGRPVARWAPIAAAGLLRVRYGRRLAQAAFRFEGLLYLQKTSEDQRQAHWDVDF